MPVGVIIPAAGRGERLGTPGPKALAPLLDRPLLTHTCRALAKLPGVAAWVVLAPAGDEPDIESAARAGLGPAAALVVRPGGASRPASVRLGLAAVPPVCDVIVIHDAARPCLRPADLHAVVREAQASGAAILAHACTDTVKRSADGRTIDGTEDRRTLWLAQTPQVFRADLLRQALAAGTEETDEAGAVERLGVPVRLVPGGAENLKITTPADLTVAAAFLRRSAPSPCASDSASINTDSSPAAG